MTFDEENNEIEHNIIFGIRDKKFIGYDMVIDLPNNDKFIKNVLKNIYKKDDKGKDTEEIESKVFIIREQNSWWGFPLYELVNGEIVNFDYTKYEYFNNTERREALTDKINNTYNPNAELKILRKTIKFILDELKLDYPDFLLYNKKIEEIINKNPKKEIK